MDSAKSQTLQIFIRSLNPKFPNRTLTLNPTQTWGDLTKSLVSSSSSSISPLFFFSFNGKTLDQSSTIASSKITEFSTINLHFKLLGGGGDGGATGAESRDCYLTMYAEKKPDKADPNEKRLSKWTTCALSNEPLNPPCVIDHLGNVFNKEAVVKALLAKSLPKPFSFYIKGLKDLIPVQLYCVDGCFQCPISGFEFNGNYNFFALRKCGHVFSAKALKEVKSSACLVCHQEYDQVDKIVINGSDDEVAVLRDRMLQLKAASKQVKKPKSKHLNSAVGVGVGVDVGVPLDSDSAAGAQLSGKKHAIEDANKLKEKLPASVVATTKDKDKDGSAKRFKAVDNAPANANKKVYASLFTSSKKKSDFRETYSCRSLPLGRN
ncbi:hypothetical protein BVRB_8g192400 [Beta vulgaris subsp. vulgaris]|nr:hypothetical protein BVRB_8g192400 [Beta vulgaris subsp. vulgaris]